MKLKPLKIVTALEATILQKHIRVANYYQIEREKWYLKFAYCEVATLWCMIHPGVLP